MHAGRDDRAAAIVLDALTEGAATAVASAGKESIQMAIKLLTTLLIVLCSATVCLAQNPSAVQSTFEITVEKGTHKTTIKSSQFPSADGSAAPADGGRLNLFYGASDDKGQDFAFNGWVPAGSKGVFTVGDHDTGFTFRASALSTVPIFMAARGSVVEIKDAPSPGGFVVGTFRGTCTNVSEAGVVETFTMYGSFKLRRH